MQGKAKEFYPKTLAEIDKEYQVTLRPSFANAINPKILQLKSTFSNNQEVGTLRHRSSDVSTPRISLPLPIEKTREMLVKKESLRGFELIEKEEKGRSSITIHSKGSLSSRSPRKKRTLRLDLRNRPSTILDSQPNSPISQTSSNGNSPRSNKEPFRNILRDERYSESVSTPARSKRVQFFPYLTEDAIQIQTIQPEEDNIPEEFRKNAQLYLMGRIMKVKLRRLLQAGDYIGVEAIEGNNLRSSALLTMKECVCISLHKDDFQKVLRQRKIIHKDKIEFFNDLFLDRAEEDRITAFSMFWGDQSCKRNEVVFRQGEPANHVFLLAEGEVKVN